MYIYICMNICMYVYMSMYMCVQVCMYKFVHLRYFCYFISSPFGPRGGVSLVKLTSQSFQSRPRVNSHPALFPVSSLIRDTDTTAPTDALMFILHTPSYSSILVSRVPGAAETKKQCLLCL